MQLIFLDDTNVVGVIHMGRSLDKALAKLVLGSLLVLLLGVSFLNSVQRGIAVRR